MFNQLFSTLFSSKETFPISELENALKDEQTVLLDVREVDEFSNGHIAQAINSPLSQLENFQGDKSKNYLVICKSGMRSQRATDFLTSQGYQAVNVKGGMDAWNGPVETEK